MVGVAAGAAICALLCSPANAKSRNSEARAMMSRFAACTVQRRPEVVRHFVLTPGVRPSPSDLPMVAPSECLWRAGEDVSQLRMRDALYRGALAEQLIRAEMAGAPVLDPSSLQALEWPQPERPSMVDERGRGLTAAALKERELRYAVAVADDYVMHLGECVVRADPAGSRAVVLTEMDSQEELARMHAMAPTIAGCVAQGQTLKFNRTTLRAALAVSYYRLGAAAHAAHAGGAA
jgi:hypothetical protein